MIVRQRDRAEPFVTKDGSTIRSLLDLSNAPVRHQSLAEATIPPGGVTEPHRHLVSEEFYYVVAGCGRMRIDDETAEIAVGDAVLIAPGAVHTLRNTGSDELRILCCCAPPYTHEDTELDADG